MISTILFIDSRVAVYQSLLTGLSGDVEVHLIVAERDGVAQMAQILNGRSGLDSIQIISHGSSGTLYLGSTVLDNTNLSSYADSLAQIGQSLNASGDILLYGCNVAQGDAGIQFINSLAQFTGADVAASNDISGAQIHGGNAALEVSTGQIDSVPIDLTKYSGTLDVITGTVGNDDIVGTSGDDTINGGGGSDTISGGNGDDAITVGGNGGAAFTTAVNGGAGTDSLTVSYAASLNDFVTLTYNGGTGSAGVHIWTDANGGVVSFQNIESLSVGGASYQLIYSNGNGPRNDILDGAGSVTGAYYSATANKVVLFDNGSFTNLSIPTLRSSYGGTAANALDIVGSARTDYIVASGTGYGANTINAGNGDDYINVSNNSVADTVYAGAGNDSVYVGINDLTTDLVLDGGVGTDTLVFNFASAGVTYTLNTGVPTSFENMVGSTQNDVLTGDSGNNDIRGGQGTDTVYGGAGNDVLYGGLTAYQATYGTNAGWQDEPAYSGAYGYSGQQGGGLNKSTWYAHYGDGGADRLYGEAGDDTLFGASGEDILDGGTGSDFLAGGSGINTFVLRVGDGGNSIAGADTISDFLDGTDALGLDGTLTYANLVITQGNGTDTAIGNTVIRTTGGEYLAVLKNTSAANFSLFDFSGLSTSPQTLSGTTASEALIGGLGNDTISGGGGSDTISGGNGDDAITVGGNGGAAFTTAVNGGAGTDSLTVSYAASLNDFVTLTYNGGTGSAGVHIWTDANGGVVSFQNIESLSVGGASYQLIYSNGNGPRNDILDGAGSVTGAYYSATANKVVLFDNGSFTNLSIPTLRSSYGGTAANALDIVGSARTDYIVASGTGYGANTINAGNGDDYINVSNNSVADTVYAGAGNDSVYVGINDLTTDLVLDGGVGTDTLVFNFASAGVTYTLNTGVPTSFENMVGSTQNDVLTGDSGNNDIRGGQGTDTVYGGAGNDVLYGGLTAYQATYGTNAGWQDEPAYSGAYGYSGQQGGGLNKSTWYAHYGDGGADRLYGEAGDDTLFGASGEDILDGGTGSDFLAGGSGIDTFVLGADAVDTISDFIAGFGGEILDVSGLLNNQVSMANGNVRFVQSEADTLFQFDADGSAGNADSFRTIAILKGVSATDINAHNFNQIVKVGTAGDDVLTGGLGEDTLSGGAGNDNLDGDWGGDVMEGGTGDDTYHVDNLGDIVSEVAGEGRDKVIALIDYVMDENIEDLDLGSGASRGTGNALDNVIRGNDAGNDIDGGSGNDKITGGKGNDNLKGGKGKDKIKGGSGNDRVDAGEGDDEIVGGDGAGDDIYIGGPGIDTVIYTSAVSTITVNLANGTASGVDIDNDTLSGIENIIGGQAGDILTGDANANVIDGFTGDDTLDGGAGADTLIGGAGNDTYLINTSRDRVVETFNNGIDSIQANIAISNRVSFSGKKIARGTTLETPDNVENLSVLGYTRANLIGNDLDNALTGNGAANVLKGMGGNDTLIGGWGRDTLYGGSGNDIIDGGSGQDWLIGGTGSDTFVFNATSDSSAFSFSLPDVITDFEPGIDKIDLSAIDAASGGGNDAFTWRGNNVNTVANSVTWFEDGANTIIRIDNTGDTVAEMQIILSSTGLGLLATHFIL